MLQGFVVNTWDKGKKSCFTRLKVTSRCVNRGEGGGEKTKEPRNDKDLSLKHIGHWRYRSVYRSVDR